MPSSYLSPAVILLDDCRYGVKHKLGIVYVLSAILSFFHSLWNINLANKFWAVGAVALIFHMSISSCKTYPWGTNIFDPVTLAFYSVVWRWKFLSSYNFWTVSARPLIFHMKFLVTRPFFWYQIYLLLTLAIFWIGHYRGQLNILIFITKVILVRPSPFKNQVNRRVLSHFTKNEYTLVCMFNETHCYYKHFLFTFVLQWRLNSLTYSLGIPHFNENIFQSSIY